jgi:excisionase family DNA binding protein
MGNKPPPFHETPPVGTTPPSAPLDSDLARTDGPSEAAPALPAVLTADELAALLRVDRKTVYNLITRGDIPGVRRLGKTIRISRDAVLRWLSEGQGRVSRSRSAR